VAKSLRFCRHVMQYTRRGLSQDAWRDVLRHVPKEMGRHGGRPSNSTRRSSW
jgi:hypothetical protein